MPTAPRKPAWIVNILMLAMLPCYVGLYALNVRQVSHGYQPDPSRWSKSARYRVGGKAAEVSFWPLQAIDRRVRPARWTYDESDIHFGGG